MHNLLYLIIFIVGLCTDGKCKTLLAYCFVLQAYCAMLRLKRVEITQF